MILNPEMLNITEEDRKALIEMLKQYIIDSLREKKLLP